MKDLRRLTRRPLPQTRDQVQVSANAARLWISCLTDRSDRHKNLLLTANLNSLTRSGKNRTNNFLYPARQHLRLSGHIYNLYTAPESQKHQEWDSLLSRMTSFQLLLFNLFSDRLECKISLSNVCTFGIDYPVHACNQGRPQKLLTGHMQSSYR